MPNKLIVVVLGMHRSGTSLITRCLETMGISTGDNLIAAKADNPKGFYEDRDFLQLDTDMLDSLNSSWEKSCTISHDQALQLLDSPFYQQATGLVAARLKEYPRFAVKDPRMILLLPFWKRVFAACGIQARYILAIRNPLSVAHSLHKRNGMSLEFGGMLWLGYVLTSLLESRELQPCLADYDQFLSRPEEELQHLASALHLSINRKQQEIFIRDFLDRRLAHTVSSLKELAEQKDFPPLISEIYARLLFLAASHSQCSETEIAGDVSRWQKEYQSLLPRCKQLDDLWAREKEILLLKLSLHSHETTLANREIQIRDQRQYISIKEDELAGCTAEIARCTEELARCTAEITRFKSVLHRNFLRQRAINTNLEALTEQHEHLRQELIREQQNLSLFAHSTSWKLTRPLRAAGRLGRRLLSLRQEKKTKSDGEPQKAVQQMHQSEEQFFFRRASRNPEEIFLPRILIIAELSIPQCKKYRVEQKKEMFASVGIHCSIVDWRDVEPAKTALSLCSLVIFYRVPAFPDTLSLFKECKRLGLRTIWDVDDLIFDADVLQSSRTIDSLEEDVRKSLIEGAHLYRRAMLLCDEGMASTAALAESMRQAGMKKVYVVENALDAETLETAASICSEKKKGEKGRKASVRIVYGSGTSTHNIDFAEAAEAILGILKERDDVVFRIIGLLDLPPEFNDVADQIERIGFCEYRQYLQYLAEGDISIAPLEQFVFNQAKSNIKYLEASILHIPSVCSPLTAFTGVIEQGKNGFTAQGCKAWRQCLLQLIDNRSLREEMGNAAWNSVMERYSPAGILEKQLSSILRLELLEHNRTRLISCNVYYQPRSFGGSTIVAEQVNKNIARKDSHEVYVIATIRPDSHVPPWQVRRYETDGGITVFGIAVPGEELWHYENSRVETVCAEIFNLVVPDLAHFHSMQGLGTGPVHLCIERGIDYVLTLHDAWWFCPRQFMITSEGKYCSQQQFDAEHCGKCCGDRDLSLHRAWVLLPCLENARLLLAPSEFFTRLCAKITGLEVICNRNGITFPKKSQPKYRHSPVRCGYVGGNTPIKGVDLVLSAFGRRELADCRLVIVDNMLNMGEPSFTDEELKHLDNYEVVPAYTQENIDGFFADIDILLFPTRWKESFGLTVREAIIRNVWVIATDAGGVVEDIIEGENGTVVPLDCNEEQFADAVISAVERYRTIPHDRAVELPGGHIRSFSEQAEELLELLALPSS